MNGVKIYYKEPNNSLNELLRYSEEDPEQGYLPKSNRKKDFLSKTAKERYAEMFDTHSKYLLNIPINKIAKY